MEEALTFSLCIVLGANQVSPEKGPIDAIIRSLRALAVTSQPAAENQEREGNNYGLLKPLPGVGGPDWPLAVGPAPLIVPPPESKLTIVRLKALLTVSSASETLPIPTRSITRPHEVGGSACGTPVTNEHSTLPGCSVLARSQWYCARAESGSPGTAPRVSDCPETRFSKPQHSATLPPLRCLLATAYH